METKESSLEGLGDMSGRWRCTVLRRGGRVLRGSRGVLGRGGRVARGSGTVAGAGGTVAGAGGTVAGRGGTVAVRLLASCLPQQLRIQCWSIGKKQTSP